MKVGLVQINNSFSGQNYLPYSIALLKSYAQAHSPTPERYDFLPFIYKRIKINDAVEQLKSADLVGFSTYVWNAQISLEISRRLKKINPAVKIIFGGPQVPDKPEQFLRDNSQITAVIHNEGERTFLNMLEMFPDENIWAQAPGVSMIHNGLFIKNLAATRMNNLEEIPSPFLDGCFDEVMMTNPNERWIGSWETNRGCPFRCTFCDWGSATAAKVTKFELERLYREIDWFAEKKIEYVFCCDANFGIQKRDVEIAEYVADVKNKTGYPVALSVQNTKNATERAYLTQKILSDAGLNKGVALSMQSVDPTTLVAIKRDNISLDTYMELQKRFTKDRVETYSDLILGLPGETYETFADGVDLLISSGQHNRIQFNNLSILPNAEMGNPEYQKQHGMRTVRSEIINIHGERVKLEDDVPEYQDLVVATNSMPAEDWVKTRIFCWMTALLHFDKIFQIPLIIANHLTGATYRELIELYMTQPRGAYPTLDKVLDLFYREARSIQNGGPEYVYSEEYLGIFWPADEYVYIDLIKNNKLDKFIEELQSIFYTSTATDRLNYEQRHMIQDAMQLNAALIHRPFVQDDIEISQNFNVLDYWNAIKTGEYLEIIFSEHINPVLVRRRERYYDDFQKWCREVVWWGNKKGAYLYSTYQAGMPLELAGHH